MGTKAKKGSQFERDISRTLSLWWSDGKNDALCWRVLGSGGRSTIRAKFNKETAGGYGDLTFTDVVMKPFFDLFLVECKKGYTKDIDPLKIIDGKGKTNFLITVYEKAEKERKFAGRRYSLIIFERNNHNSCVMFNSKIIEALEDYAGCYNGKELLINTGDEGFYIMPLESFLDWVSPETIKLILEEKF